MGRRENPVDPEAGPVQRFAFELRELRAAAGLTYRALAERTAYTVSTLSRAAGGEQLPSLEVTLAYVRACGGNSEVWERRWRRAVQETAGITTAEDVAGSPYQGLKRFETQDRERFYGRDALVADVLRLVRAKPLAAVVGASGSGKSSLLRAGLIPALRDPAARLRPAVVRVITPGPRPGTEHARRLRPKGPAGDTVVVVDQFEEVFTLCRDAAERTAFLDLVATAQRPGSRLRIVLAVRADFFGRCAEHRGIAGALRGAVALVGPMSREELREVIVKPAQGAGLLVERALTARLVEEVAGEPGGLPLLSHVLLETWRRSAGRGLTVQAYEAAGGLHGAIAQTAEELFAGFTAAQAAAARRILLRLVTPGEGARDTRRPADREELDADRPDGTGEVLERLAGARLITLDGRTVDLCHEALISQWPRLHAWVEEDRERLRVHRRLTEAARIWEDLGRDSAALYRGVQLAAVRHWAADPADRAELNASERAFIDAAVALKKRERAAAVRRERRLRGLAAGLALLLVTVTAVGAVAIRQRQAAEGARQIAVSRQLAAEALALADSQPDTAMLLSIEAYRIAPTPEARSALLSLPAHQYFRGRLTGHTDAVSQVAFAPDGTLASVGRDQRLILWDTTRRTRSATITGHATWLRTVAVSPDGRLIATGGDDRAVVLWNAVTHRKTATLHGHTDLIHEAAFSPDSRLLATAGADHTVRVWDVAGRRPPRTLVGHADVVNAVAFSPDGHLLATASADHTVRVWQAATGTPIGVLTGHTQSVDGVAFSPDGRTLATASQDRTARLWDVRRRTVVATLSGHESQVRAVAFSPDGRTLATAGHDNKILLWDAHRYYREAVLAGHISNVYTLAFNPGGSLLASAGEDGTILLWDIARIPLAGHTDHINDIAYSPDGRTLASAGDDQTVVLWNAAHHTRLATLSGGSGPVDGVAFSPDGRVLATATGTAQHPPRAGDYTVTLWDTTTHQVRTRLLGHTDRVRRVAFSPDGRIIASVSSDRTVRLWDATRPGPPVILSSSQALSQAVSDAAFSPDGRLLAVSQRDRRTILWDVARRTRLATLTGHTGPVTAVAFSPDGRSLATTSLDQTVMLWDVARRTRLATLADHTGPAYDVAFSRDGRTLASASGDTTVVLWDLARRTPLATLTGHTQQVRTIAFSPDGHTLAVGSDDHTVVLWDTNPQQARRQLCASAGRDLTRQEWQRFLPETPYQRTCART